MIHNVDRSLRAALTALQRLVAFGALATLSTMTSAPAEAASALQVPQTVRDALAAGTQQEVIVELDQTDVATMAQAERQAKRLRFDDRAIIDRRTQEYKNLKDSVFGAMVPAEFELVRDFGHLPMALVRLKRASTLKILEKDSRVKAVYIDSVKRPVLDSATTSLINLSTSTTYGVTGAGTTVAVIDTGVDYTVSDFGPCTSPGVPSSCKVNYYQNFADGSTALDSNHHGTNVAGIAVAVAPGTKIAALNVFGASSTTTDSLIISAIDWAISNQSTYHIVAINMSLGDSVNYGSGCSNSVYYTPVFNALVAGIASFAAAGNNGFSNGVSSPACTYSITAVGAVYSTNIGAQNYGICSDASTAADQVTCFANLPPTSSTGYNFILAPGANITAGGFTYSGTSQATPFISATQALAASMAPNSSFLYPTPVGDAKSITRGTYSATLNRLDIDTTLRAGNDNFSNGANYDFYQAFDGNSVRLNQVASKETGEPNHAGNAGGHSVWFTWTPTATGSMTVDTHGSTFDTLLAVYTGSSVSALTQIAANDDDGSPGGTSSLSYTAQAGTAYKIAVDGKNGAYGGYGIAIHPQNDNFASATVISGSTGSLTSSIEYATAETGEQQHAGIRAAQSVWWKWTAPATGQVTFNTHGSNFNTVLDAEQGSSVSTTTVLASNDDDGSSGGASSIFFPVQVGATYYIAVDIESGSGQMVELSWNLNTSTQTDLSLSLSGGSGLVDQNVTYTATATNNGTGVPGETQLTITLPSGVTYESYTQIQGTATCSADGQIVSCMLGTLGAGSSISVAINVQATQAGSYTASASLTSNVTDTNTSNNAASGVDVITSPSTIVPALPPWAIALLAFLLVATARRAGGQALRR